MVNLLKRLSMVETICDNYGSVLCYFRKDFTETFSKIFYLWFYVWPTTIRHSLDRKFKKIFVTHRTAWSRIFTDDAEGSKSNICMTHIVHEYCAGVKFAWLPYAPDSRRIHAGCVRHIRESDANVARTVKTLKFKVSSSAACLLCRSTIL
jgi:hypothetical protein